MTPASEMLSEFGLTAGEASLLAIVAFMVIVAIIGVEQRLATFATIAGVIVLLISASA